MLFSLNTLVDCQRMAASLLWSKFSFSTLTAYPKYYALLIIF